MIKMSNSTVSKRYKIEAITVRLPSDAACSTFLLAINSTPALRTAYDEDEVKLLHYIAVFVLLDFCRSTATTGSFAL